MPLRAPPASLAVVFVLALAGGSIGVPEAPRLFGGLFGTGLALADDDDGGSDDSGSDDSDSSDDSDPSGPDDGVDDDDVDDDGVIQGDRRAGGSGRSDRGSRRVTVSAGVARVDRQVPRQIVALGLDDAAIAELTATGYSVRDRGTVSIAGADMVKLTIPRGVTLEAARARVASAAPGAAVDLNHFYRPDGADAEPCGSDNCLARNVVGWPQGGAMPGTCAAPTRIGLIDTAINSGHLAFVGAKVETIRLEAGNLPDSGRQHGTAVAALLVGSAEGRTPGLVPGGELIAVDAFHRGAGDDDRSAVYDLVRAIDLLAARGVKVINMSLTGPPNLLLKQAIERAAARGIVLVAAAGNDGPRAAPLYPAAYDVVIAVTAIDRAKNPYRRAGAGEHIDIAAPGVQVWTAASIKGAQPKTGTSFAAPFVTAAVAILKAANPALGAEEVEALLRQNAEDLGAPGKDPIYGWGLLNGRAICQG